MSYKITCKILFPKSSKLKAQSSSEECVSSALTLWLENRHCVHAWESSVASERVLASTPALVYVSFVDRHSLLQCKQHKLPP